MGIVYPSKAVARRWNGALQARLRRAPLEAFLRVRSVAPALSGVSQDSDNLVRATVLIVEAGIALYCADREEGISLLQRPVVGHVTCLVSLALAQQISQPDAWRTVALVSTAQLLGTSIGLNAAAVASATIVRQFQNVIMKGISPLDWRIMNNASDAVRGYGAVRMAAANIATRLHVNGSTATDGAPRTEDGRAEQRQGSRPLRV
jgi:hypothetical protein